MWSADFTGRRRARLRRRGRGLRPLVRKTCDAAVSIPLGGQVDSLNVSVAAGDPALRGPAPARMPDPTLYLFDGFNVLRASELRGRARLVDRLASFVALRAPAAWSSSTAPGRIDSWAACRALRRARRRAARAARRREPRRSASASSPRTRRSAASGQEVMKRSSRTFRRARGRARRAREAVRVLRTGSTRRPARRLERLRRGGG